jgi:hypothetical protein
VRGGDRGLKGVSRKTRGLPRVLTQLAMRNLSKDGVHCSMYNYIVYSILTAGTDRHHG